MIDFFIKTMCDLVWLLLTDTAPPLLYFWLSHKCYSVVLKPSTTILYAYASSIMQLEKWKLRWAFSIYVCPISMLCVCVCVCVGYSGMWSNKFYVICLCVLGSCLTDVTRGLDTEYHRLINCANMTHPNSLIIWLETCLTHNTWTP